MERLTLSVPETARLLGVGRDKAYEMAHTGRIPVLRIGRRLLVPRDALVRWIDNAAREDGP
jgi:excisionase family DNA binding protein